MLNHKRGLISGPATHTRAMKIPKLEKEKDVSSDGTIIMESETVSKDPKPARRRRKRRGRLVTTTYVLRKHNKQCKNRIH